MYIERSLTATFKTSLKLFPSILVTGPRQSGKTTFIQHIMKDAAYISFDDPLNRDFVLQDPNGFLNQFDGRTAVLDEIQYVPEILPYIKMRIDQDRAPGKWILTGSQQFHLMKNISETLAGRIAILELAPFSFHEFASYKNASLEEIVWTGLFPEPACYPEKRDIWLRSYFQTYIERDVRQLDAIKNYRSFELFMNLCAAFHSQEFHAAALARDCGVSQPTIKSWYTILETSYLGISLPPFFKNYGKRLIKKSKFYLFDPSLVCYLTRQPSAEASISGHMGGMLFEGFIISEVWKAFYSIGKKPSAYFWRSQGGLEVDLILPAQGKLWPVEIKLTSTPSSRHAKALNRFKKLAGNDASDVGMVVCRTSAEKLLPGNNKAVPWNEFSKDIIKIISDSDHFS